MHSSIRHARGVTLIELVIVVGIVSILAAFAYPSYVERAQRAKRTDAKAALINIAGQQERFFFKNNRFATNLAELDVSAFTQNEYYKLALEAGLGTSEFKAIATPEAIQDGDERCTQFTIDQIGRKGASGQDTDRAPVDCWR